MQINWFSPTTYRNRGIIFSGVLCCTVSFSSQYHHTKGGETKRRRELLVAKALIVNISNKATGMFNKSEPPENYSSEGFRWNQVEHAKTGRDETGCSVDEWNPFQTQVKGFIVQCGQGFNIVYLNEYK